MKERVFFVSLFLLITVGVSCVSLKETMKTIWGSSTNALEKARTKALTKTFRCDLDACFEKVLVLTRPPVVSPTPSPTPSLIKRKYPQPAQPTPTPAKPPLDLFLKDKTERHLVVMGVPNCVDTTEVGIFFEPAGDGLTRVEISSLSTNAKMRAAEIIFQHLEKSFAVAP